MALPSVLAGPILRASDQKEIVIWIATSEKATFQTKLFVVGERDRSGVRSLKPVAHDQVATSLSVGSHLFVHLLRMRAPQGQRFPDDCVIAYDMSITMNGITSDLESLFKKALGYAALGQGDTKYLPTLTLSSIAGPFLHASCRKLHGAGNDAFPQADEALQATWEAPLRRPLRMFLTGDQIYADDVAVPLLDHLTELHSQLFEYALSLPGYGPLFIPDEDRTQFVADKLGFTSGACRAHLVTFAEFAAMYLVALSPACWPPKFLVHLYRWRQERMEEELAALEKARVAMPAVQRVLANIPTYMMFDDHEVTDDWNLDADWRTRVSGTPLGRWVIANALAAFWLFQGWGNAPDQRDDSFAATVLRLAARERVEEKVLAAVPWTFALSTQPAIVLADTRTTRAGVSGKPSDLLGEVGRQALKQAVIESGYRAREALIIVSPAPVLGFTPIELGQKLYAMRAGPYAADAEAWGLSAEGFLRFFELVVGLRPRACIILSGDVHYGFTVEATVRVRGMACRVVQLTSSALKNKTTGLERAEHISRYSGFEEFAAFIFSAGVQNPVNVKIREEIWGWFQRPRSDVQRRLRAIGTPDAQDMAHSIDEQLGSGGAIMLDAGTARRLELNPADVVIERSIVKTGPSYLVASNNLGIVLGRFDELTHVLLTEQREPNTATVRL